MAMKQGELPAVVPQIYEHEQFGKIRVVKIGEEVKFFGSDVATALGYTNPRKALADHIPDKFKLVSQIVTAGQRRTVTLISEEGLYRLTFRSKLPEAEKFTDWACEIMISVRKTGSYTLPESDPRAIFTPTYIRQIADRIESLENQVTALTEENAQLKPKADYCERILQSKEALTVTVIAKDYGMGGAQFNDLLAKLKIQYKVGKTWVLYQDYANKGYTVTETKLLPNGLTVTITRWLQKGRMFLYHKLKDIGIVPVVERTEPMATLPGLNNFTYDGGFAPQIM